MIQCILLSILLFLYGLAIMFRVIDGDSFTFGTERAVLSFLIYLDIFVIIFLYLWEVFR